MECFAMSVSSMSAPATSSVSTTRWTQLGLGLIAMMSISSPQYVWTLFTKPLTDTLHAPLSAIQVTLKNQNKKQTKQTPTQNKHNNKNKPKLLIACGCLLSGLGWV